MRIVGKALLIVACWATSGAAQEPPPAPPERAPDSPWCTPEVETLSNGMCHFKPERDQPPDTLVIFLHGLVKLGTTWQYNQQLAPARFAKQNGFEVLMPRGRLGSGKSRYPDYYNWPTSAEAQERMEQDVIGEWMAAKAELEQRNGRRFKRVYVFGFSAGAYYAASLLLRGRINVDGYGVFAGGGAPKHVERWAKGTHPKPAVYVGWGTKDKARKDPQKLARALKAMGWPHKAVPRPNVGHSMTDAQIRDAYRFLQTRNARPSKAASE